MGKIYFKKYHCSQQKQIEEDELDYWLSISPGDKLEAAYSLLIDFNYMKGIDVDAQRLQPVYRITKFK